MGAPSYELLRRLREIRKRHSPTDEKAWDRAEVKLEGIQSSLRDIQKRPQDAVSHIISRGCAIEMISFLEWRVRGDYATLIDHNRDNLKRIGEFQKLQFSIDQVSELWTEEYTLGDLIAHTLPHSSTEDIIKNFRLITGVDPYERLKKSSNKIPLVAPDAGLTIDRSFIEIKKATDSIFSYRHIVCHEFTAPNIETEQVHQGCLACFIFWQYWDNLVKDELDSYPPEKALAHELSKNSKTLGSNPISVLRSYERFMANRV